MSAMGSRCLIGGDLGVSDCRASELIGFDNYVQFRSLHLQFIILSLRCFVPVTLKFKSLIVY